MSDTFDSIYADATSVAARAVRLALEQGMSGEDDVLQFVYEQFWDDVSDAAWRKFGGKVGGSEEADPSLDGS